MTKILIALVLSAGTLACAASAQAPVATIAPTTGTVLRAGTAIPMKTREALTTNGKLLRVGQRVNLEVAENVMMNGQIVIPAGSPAVGELTTVRNKGMWGKSGAINGRVLYARVGDRQIRMSGTFDDKGKTGTGGVIASVALIPVAGFFMTGTSAALPLGTPVGAFLDEDVAVTMASAPTAPATLQATVPATTDAQQPKVIPAALTTASK